MYKKLLTLSAGFIFIACNSTSTMEKPVEKISVSKNSTKHFQNLFYIENKSYKVEPMKLKVPEYPLKEYEAGHEGVCDVYFKLEEFYTTDKRTIYSPIEISVLNCSSANFMSACKNAVIEWRFAIMNNEKENAQNEEFKSICTFKI